MANLLEKNQKDFWTGILFLAVGVAALLISRGYECGTTSKMGPGYFPTALGLLLSAVGIVSLARSLIKKGARVQMPAIKPLLYVCGSTVLFGLLLRKAGLIGALLVLILVSASASSKFKFEWRALFGMVGLIVFCVFVFVKFLGMPMPLVGSWFVH